MKLMPTALLDLWELETQPKGDERGQLTRLFCQDSLAQAIGRSLQFVQTNLSYTARRGTVRGMHFQRAPAAEVKLIRCIRGEVFDVAVDLRPESRTFGQWHGVHLSAHNQKQILIPEGFAHGFQALTDHVELLYQHTTAYTPTCEAGVRHDDATLKIDWPQAITLVSPRDASLPSLQDLFPGASQ